MNNKQIGTAFERELCELLAKHGIWVHFLSPDNRGAQPFDVIAVINNRPIAIDCKTCKNKTFSISRLEDNQMYAFRKWLDCGNDFAYIAIKHEENIFMVDFETIKELGRIDLEKDMACIFAFEHWLEGIKLFG